MYWLKCFMLCLFYVGSENLCIPRKTTDLINMSTYANLLLIQMKRQDSECVCIILLVKNIFVYLYCIVTRDVNTSSAN